MFGFELIKRCALVSIEKRIFRVRGDFRTSNNNLPLTVVFVIRSSHQLISLTRVLFI